MKDTSNFIEALSLWHKVCIRTLKENDINLNARQTGILLTVYLGEPPHTIRSLAAALNISKPAVCRAVDTLEKYGFVKRKEDTEDRRNIFLQRTIKGSVYLCDFAEIIEQEILHVKTEDHEPA
jgi:DNA-binding MarR family transcriptional regulator